MRLAGTWKQYSKKAIIQLITITFNNGTLRYFRWPYQAKVMKMLETVSRAIVRMERDSAIGDGSITRSTRCRFAALRLQFVSAGNRPAERAARCPLTIRFSLPWWVWASLDATTP